MNPKKYALVRVDNKCSLDMEENYRCTEDLRKDSCKKCKEIYGDTKEQFIKKVAQARFKQEIEEWYEHFDEKPNKTIVNCLWKRCLRQAKEIVEFLGVNK